jgi:hypothetical protein
MINPIKAMESYLEFLIVLKEECETEEGHDELDEKIGSVLRQLMPLQDMEIIVNE